MGLYLIAASPWYLDPNSWLAIFMGVAGLGFVIFVHELGHFLAAKACGVKCEKFYIGFDVPIKIGPFRLPSSLFKYQYGETEYGIGILPLGGYVKMLGQDDDPRNATAENERIRVKAEHVAEEFVPAPNENSAKYELDPRSFPAKAVWQRMIIISAGVTVNLIFAVIFAAFAFRNGVSYMPTVIGGALPGTPAWNAGVQSGDRILQMGREGGPREHLRYDWDLAQNVALNGKKDEMDILVRHSDGKEEWLKVRPRGTKSEDGERATIGVTPMGTLELNPAMPALEYLPAGKADFKGGDRIIAINGQPVKDYPQLMTQLWQHLDEEVTISVDRTTPTEKKSEVARTEKVDVKVAPNHRKTLGFVMNYGPIQAIRPNSPAAKAGLKVGDRIETIGDEPFGDPFTVSARLHKWFGKEVELKVKRSGDGKESDLVSVKITPEAPSISAELQAAGPLFGVDALGIAFPVARTVQAVIPGSPAAEKQFQPGDKITKFQWVIPSALKEKMGRKKPEKVVDLDDEHQTWADVDNDVQAAQSGMTIQLTFERGSQTITAELQPVESAEFTPQRGFAFTSLSETHVAESWGEAIGLGVRQTKEDALRVVTMLKKLVTGKVSPTNLGGPLMIFSAAGAEAMRGWTRLLIFLTMLSANLAVLNFLPIPVLDGGHMVFLAWEGIFRKPVNERVQMTLTMTGLCGLLCLMVFVFGMDIWRFIRIFG